MKRILSLALALVLLFSLCAAASAEGGKELTVWYSGGVNGKALNKAAELYCAANPDVTLHIEEVATGDRETRLTVALSSGDMSGMPDVTLFQDYSSQKFLQFFPDCFVELSDAFDFSQFAPDKVGYWTYEDGVYGVPFDSAASGTFARLDYLEAAGYTLDDLTDITWDEFIEIGLKVKEATGKYMLTESGYSNLLMVMVKSSGGWYFNEDGTANLVENEGAVEALKTLKKLHESGIVMENSDWASYIASLNNGDVVCTVTGNWILGSIVAAEDQSGKWGMTNVPSLSEDKGHYASNGGSSWVVLSSSQEQELAKDFLQIFTDEEFNSFVITELATVPTYLPAQNLDCIKAPYAFTNGQAVFADIMDFTAKTPVVEYGPFNSEVDGQMMVAMQEVFDGKDVLEALKTAEETVNFLIEE